MLQYFNTEWNEITARMPELAEAGYNSIWVPPPTKGSGGLSVGYDLWDRFDLGGKDQRGSVRTRYGTEADFMRMIETAHRFGIRVYLDTIMNHNAFDIPGYNADTPIDVYPGFVPEDFHLRVTEDGFYRKWDNTRSWGDAWQVQNLGLSDLIDIAQEPGDTNLNFGATEGSQAKKIKRLRTPDNPEYYCFLPNGTYVGFGPNNGITKEMLQANKAFYSERVEDFLNRTVRWLVDRSKADGLRLDAVKHVRADFFGATFGDKDFNDYGYLGQAQRQFNLSRGFSDPNHRDSVFDKELKEQGRDDLMMFGEHLGEPPGFGPYIDAGMRLVDNPLRQQFNDRLGSPSNGLQGYDQPGSGGFAPEHSVMHAQSHDSDYAARRELQHAFYFTRAGLGLIYTDGNHHAETLGESGGAFPRHSNTSFLGQFGDVRVPNLLYIHNQFARGEQRGKWSDGDFVAYERIDKRENNSMSDADGVTLLFMLNDNFASGQARSFSTSFPAQGGTPSDAYLFNYSSYGGGFYKWASELGSTVVPPGGYFVFSWRNPEESDLWRGAGGSPLQILQNGQPVGTLTYERKDGPDGDPAFNPNSAPDANTNDYKYAATVPRVTDGSSLTFLARADGSAENVLLKLDGGIDLNSHIPLGPTAGEKRDHQPAFATDVFVGYEQAQFVHRQFAEKFAATNTARCTFGSAGAETYVGGGATVNGFGTNPRDAQAAVFAFHNPTALIDPASAGGAQPPHYSASGGEAVIWVKTNSVGLGYSTFVYYTTDGSNPEGAGGAGTGTTKAAPMAYQHNGADGNSWWRGAFTPGDGTLRYKIGVFKTGQSSVFPAGPTQVDRKKKMMTVFRVPDFNATTATVYPHNDYGQTQIGLAEGFHVLRGRAFLNRAGRASIYNTFTQTFYYDAAAPGGEVTFPGVGETVGGSQYGAVVRTDPSVTEVWYNIADSDAANDDSATRAVNGNGAGFEPFTDSNQNGQRDTGEAFDDLNGNGTWDSAVAVSWVRATEVTPSASIASDFQKEWRFNYTNIPSSGQATIRVRLREMSSAAFAQFGGAVGDADDEAKHYTTLLRTITAAGPDTRMFVGYPQADGDVIGTGYKVKILFSKSLADGVSPQELISRFLIKIASSESGSSNGGVTQGQSDYQINYLPDGPFHELQFPRDGVSLPNLYNGVPNFLHAIDVTHTRPSAPLLQARRLVRFAPTAAGPFVSILNPPEFDSDGKRFEIILPDVPAPTAEQRQYPIQVETDLAADNVSIGFVNNSGTATLIAPHETAVRGSVAVVQGSAQVQGFAATLTGTVSVSTNSTAVTGSGTGFANQLSPGDLVTISGVNGRVAAIQSATSLTLTAPFGGGSASGVSIAVQPVFDEAFSIGEGIKIAGETYTVATIASPTLLTLDTSYIGVSASGLTVERVDVNPKISGNRKRWEFLWSGITEGTFTFTANVDTDSNPATTEASATRNATVLFRQQVASNPNDFDDDEDGLLDVDEMTAVPLPNARVQNPKPNPEDWTNGEVHQSTAFGRSNPLSPDTDADGLPDATEVGWRGPSDTAATVANADTNGDGVPNFSADLDPPFYNTLDNEGRVPGVNSRSEGGDRAKRLVGTTTDPNNGDTDGDGIADGVEDANQNGWVDGDGAGLPATFNPFLAHPWPNGKEETSETWIETAPTLGDSDTDGLSDGYGEDKNVNGRIDGDMNNNRVYDSGETWTESDPLDSDTDGDGLTDGWEVANGLDPLDNGADTLRSASPNDGSGNNGPNGDSDGDGFTNFVEQSNGTDPRVADTGTPPPAGQITIGPVPDAQKVVVGGVTNFKEFTDWTADDVIMLDEYEGGGSNNQGGDTFPGYDGFDPSRDIVAFYARDGGADGNYYFRVDFHDLRALAEEANLDIYVAIDTNSPGLGERKLPDDVDVLTDMRWEAVVACYKSNSGRVYVDAKRAPAENTVSLADDLNAATFGVEARDQTAGNGFRKAYFNSELDACEFSISRDALIAAGWNGVTPLNFQVFTTRDGTGNNPVGVGDIGGRNDIRDTIFDDFLAEDHYNSQSYIAANGVLKGYFGLGDGVANDRGKRAKIISLVHGNQAILPGSSIQALINTATGAGYYRPLDVHQAYAAPITMHITPTLASAIEWAKADPSSPRQYRDGPALNARLRTLATGSPRIVNLLGSTFSDHMLPYFTTAFNESNVALADEFLTHFYVNKSDTVFWTPERVADAGVLGKIGALGYEFTFVDQMRHVLKWFGRSSALGDDGYRVNLINGVRCLPISDAASVYRFQNNDKGAAMPMRELLARKAASGTRDQVVVLFSAWEDFTSVTNADAYDANARWLASHPWIQIVTPDQIANGEIDLSRPPDGRGDAWGVLDRGASSGIATVAHDFIDHATQEDYDNWYLGSGNEESLRDKVFQIRTGVPLPTAYGLLDAPSPSGLISAAWTTVNGLAPSVKGLALGTLFASVFETAFHDQANNDLSKFSTGEYINPDTSFQLLAGFSKAAQAQTRTAAQYARVAQWASSAASAVNPVAQTADVDLDGESEYVLYNDRLFALFERLGGRLIGVWVRDIETGAIRQALGNPLSAANSETEEEGDVHLGTASGKAAHRTSGFKDWFAQTGSAGVGTNAYVNDFYAAAAAPAGTGWKFTSADGRIVKTITLAARNTKLDAIYTLSGGVNKVFVRFGLSPDLANLLLDGQRNLSLIHDATRGEVSVLNDSGDGLVRAFVKYGGTGYAGAFNSDATDREAVFDTVNMRNQAQTHQIEIEGVNNLAFALGFQTGATVSIDSDNDTLPDWWEAEHELDPASALGDDGSAGDGDHDGKSNQAEFILRTNPGVADGTPATTVTRDGNHFIVSFPTLLDRVYQVYFTDDLSTAPVPVGGEVHGTGGSVSWTDDGSETGGAPLTKPRRFYRVQIRLP